MTFSIAARCERTGQLGVGAVTAMVGVGKLVSHAKAGVGAVATQANINPYLGFDGLRLMERGVGAEQAVADLVADDPGREYRQCGMVDHTGGSAAWTGSETPDWSGHRTGPDFAAQGNRLVGPETIDAVVAAFTADTDRPLVERLLRAMEAGEATGADKKGALSGTLYVMDAEEYPLWDVRVDHADDPVVAMRELCDEMGEELVPQVRRLSTREDPVGELTREEMQRAS